MRTYIGPGDVEQTELAVALSEWFRQTGSGYVVLHADHNGVKVKHRDHYEPPETWKWSMVKVALGLAPAPVVRKRKRVVELKRRTA